MLDKGILIELAANFLKTNQGNRLPDGESQIYDEPIFAFGDALDEKFLQLKDPCVIGEHFRLPHKWLPQARTVISFFLPYTKHIRFSNREDKHWPSMAWLHGRYEGQIFLQEFSRYLCNELNNAGFPSVIPSQEDNFWANWKQTHESQIAFSSNWSQRHVAYVCGLGTFGLSGGLITQRGMAGRIGSIITHLQISPSNRDYSHRLDYCTKCGLCIEQCPANAITMDYGKDHVSCSEHLQAIKERFEPRYGCGKCQVKVPCESRIPRRI